MKQPIPAKTYDPTHPLNPDPPTFWNRLICLFTEHYWVSTKLNHYTWDVTSLCMRCSRTMTVRLSTGSIVDEPEEPQVVQE